MITMMMVIINNNSSSNNNNNITALLRPKYKNPKLCQKGRSREEGKWKKE